MREIVLDTETTGISPRDGHRIIEIGALELIHHMPTGKRLHIYINPERDIDDGAVAVHGLTNIFLRDKPTFASVVDKFIAFIGEAPLVIHNASFDMAFINAELERVQYQTLSMDRAIDTLAMARKKFPGAQASLDALCRRFEIEERHNRNLHGAMIDADLLASVYLELIGGRQPALSLNSDTKIKNKMTSVNNDSSSGSFASDGKSTRARPIRPHSPTIEEETAHEFFIKSIENAIWLKD